MPLLFAAFILVPLAEIGVFIQLGGWLGLWPTLALIVLTAVVGTWMLRLQGFAVLDRGRRNLERGVPPVREVVDGVCLLVAGALLLTPGFITDAVGALLLLPPVRAAIFARLSDRIVARGAAPQPPGRGPVIDVDYEDLDDPPEEPGPPRGGWGPRR